MVNKLSSEKALTFIFLIIICFVVGFVYLNSLKAPFTLDDFPKIVENPDIQKLSNLKSRLIYPYEESNRTFNRNSPLRPLTSLTFALNYHFNGLNPQGYHLFDIVLHMFTAVLVFFFTRMLLRVATGEKSLNVPLIATCIFALHPVNTVAVDYIYKRSDQLMTAFYVLSFLFYSIAGYSSAPTRLRMISAITASCICFVLSLSAKPSAVTFPLMLTAFDFLFICRNDFRKLKTRIFLLAPSWLILVLYLLLRVFFLKGIGDTDAALTWSWKSYAATQPYVILNYVKFLIFPAGLCFDHAVKPVQSLLELKFIIPVFLGCLLLLSGIFIYKKKSAMSNLLVFSMLWFFVTLMPASSVFPTTTIMDESRVYIAGIGFFLLVGAIEMSMKKRITFAFIFIYIAVLAALTYERNLVYSNPMSLWKDVTAKYPESFRAHLFVGLEYFSAGNFSSALNEYETALKLNPRNADIHLNAGNVYFAMRQFDAALHEYEKAAALEPSYYKPHFNLGLVYANMNQNDKAITEFEIVLDLQPANAEAKEYIKALLKH